MGYQPRMSEEWELIRSNHLAWTAAERDLLPEDIEWLNWHRALCGQSATYPPSPPPGPGAGSTRCKCEVCRRRAMSPAPDNSWIQMEQIG